MTTDITEAKRIALATIPPEAVEAAAMAMFDATPFREHDGAFCEQSERYQAFTRVLATAALRAGIAAWPGMMFNGEEVIDGDVYPAIIYLVIRMEPRDDA